MKETESHFSDKAAFNLPPKHGEDVNDHTAEMKRQARARNVIVVSSYGELFFVARPNGDVVGKVI